MTEGEREGRSRDRNKQTETHQPFSFFLFSPCLSRSPSHVSVVKIQPMHEGDSVLVPGITSRTAPRPAQPCAAFRPDLTDLRLVTTAQEAALAPIERRRRETPWMQPLQPPSGHWPSLPRAGRGLAAPRYQLGFFPWEFQLILHAAAPHALCSYPVTWFQEVGTVGNVSAHCSPSTLYSGMDGSSEVDNGLAAFLTFTWSSKFGETAEGYSMPSYTNRVHAIESQQLMVTSVIG